MIRIVFFDLGLTFVDADHRPFPHVADALRTIQGFKTADGKPLATALVSDFTMPAPPATPAKVKALFEEYLAVLDQTGLRPLFEPVDRRVTLSTHAGVMKPDRGVFETALRRLRSKATLAECLFVTENAAHVRAARTKLHMATLRFRSAGSGKFDFDDWLQAPALVAHLVAPAEATNAEAALRSYLSIAHGFDVQEIGRAARRGATRVRGTLWKPVGAAAGAELANVHAPFPVEGEVTRGADGRIGNVRLSDPRANERAEAAAFVRSLARHGQVESPVEGRARGPVGSSGGPARAATHDIETDAQGRRKLVRKRFRAV